MSSAGRGRLVIRHDEFLSEPAGCDLNNLRRNRTLALAGVFQAAALVQQLAHHGRADETALTASINSVLAIDAPSAEAVYGDARGVTLGLRCLTDNLHQPKNAEGVEIAHYVARLLQLERTLGRDTVMLATIRHRLKSLIDNLTIANGKKNAGAETQVATKLAELYRATLSTIKPRIMVTGEHGHLNDPTTAEMVRAVLLAGIRSAYLWRQLGGARWQLFINKQTTVSEARRILEQLARRLKVTQAHDL